jgi:hypothetical protein
MIIKMEYRMIKHIFLYYLNRKIIGIGYRVLAINLKIICLNIKIHIY